MSYQITQYYFLPRQLYLSSRYATLTQDQRKKNHCWFSLVDTIIIPKDYDNLLIEVQDAQIPISFYTVNETNNTIGFTTDSNDVVNIAISPGNYDAFSLALTLQILINDLYPAIIQIEVIYSMINNKFVFRKVDGTATTFTLHIGEYASTIWGFETESIITSVNDTITSTGGVDLAGSRFIFVQSPSFNTTNINSKTGTTNQIIAKIPVTEEYLGIEQFKNSGFTNKIHNTTSISVIEIVMLDENLNDIDFNGVDWSITLNITILGQPLEALLNTGPSKQIVG